MSSALRVFVCAVVAAAFFQGSRAAEDAAPQEPGTTGEQEFRLEFQNQPWLPALQWFAERAELNLDWQELPEGEFNLSAQRPYTLQEIRDVLNMQLLVRGYTLLQRGDVLRVVPLENLDPTLVARVQPDELETLPSHQFVRVSFPLEWMVAEDAARELGALLSPYGKLIPLSATNQLEAMDAVVNLREIKRLLDREQSDSGKKRLVEEFVLDHRRAYDVADMLRQLLGLQETRYRRSSDVMRMQLERTKLQSQAVKELGENATRFLKEEADVNLVVNEEENSILVHAPPDKVEVIRQAVETLDRPSSKEDSVWENISRVKVYKVENVDTDAIRDMIEEMQELGRLSPETRVEEDGRNDTLIAYATPTDHMTLAHLVRSFQQEPREAHVLQLGVLEPRYAAQAVRVLFKQDDDDNDRWRRRRYGGDSEESQFRVESDTQNRRLLLWATPTERTRVEEYLGELGEQSTAAAGQQGTKVLQAGTADLSELEAKLRGVWGNVSNAPLVIQAVPGPDVEPPADGEAEPEVRQSSSPQPDEKTTSENDLIRTASILQVATSEDEEECAVVEQDEVEASEETGEDEPEPAEEEPDQTQQTQDGRPPVRVIAGPDGRLIVTSDDPAAAQLMTQLLESLLPKEKDVHVFPLRYASALSIEFQVQDLLDVGESTYEDDPFGSQPQLVVYSDGRTNSLLVRNANPEQLESIQNLINVLDRPEKVEPDLARQQRIYRVRNKDASELAETIKEVYRDLLSSTDKAFAGGGGDDSGRIRGYWGFASARSTVPEYQGLLSVGVDAASNSVVVSAPKYLMDEVMELAQSLDDQASAQAVTVVRLPSGMNNSAVRESLSEMLGQTNSRNDRRDRRGRRR